MLRIVFEYFLSLSFHQNLTHKLPAQLHHLVVAEPPACKPVILSEEEQTVYRIIKEQVRVKEADVDSHRDLFLRNSDLFWLAIMDNGSKTPTHFAKLVEVYAPLISQASQANGPGPLLKALHNFFETFPQRLEMAVLVLLKEGLATPSHVVKTLEPDLTTVSGCQLGVIALTAAINDSSSDLVMKLLSERNQVEDVERVFQQAKKRVFPPAIYTK
jgi:hypothetical protein